VCSVSMPSKCSKSKLWVAAIISQDIFIVSSSDCIFSPLALTWEVAELSVALDL